MLDELSSDGDKKMYSGGVKSHGTEKLIRVSVDIYLRHKRRMRF